MIDEHAEIDKRNIENAVIKAAADNAEIDIPQCMIEQQIDYKLQETEYSLMYQGIDMNTYLNYIGTTVDKLREDFRASAQDTVRSQLTLEAIMKAENVEVDASDIDKQIKERAEQQKKTVEEVKADMSDDMLEYIKDRVRFDKVVDILTSSAKVTRVEEK